MVQVKGRVLYTLLAQGDSDSANPLEQEKLFE